jgi:hypothetical protein
VAVATAVGLAAMAVAWALRSAIVPTDPWHYVQGALAFPEGTWRPAGLSRWGYLLPIIPFARAWGDATATYYAIPLLTTGVLAGVLYLLGSRFVARAAGLLGVLLVLGTPLILVNLTRGYTDLTATTLVGLALLLVTLAQDAAERGAWRWRVPALLLAGGFVTGWSFEVRETAVFAWPVIAYALWRVAPPLRALAWFAPPALAWLVLDLVMGAFVYDDPLLKLRTLSGADISASEVTSDAGYVGQSRWWYVTILPRSVLTLSAGPAVLLCLLVGIIGGFAFRAQLGRIWTWGMLSLGLLSLQGGVLDPAHPSVRLDVARYWMSFLVPLILAAAGSLVIMLRRARPGPQAWLVLGLAGAMFLGLLVPSARFVAGYPGLVAHGGGAMAELRDHLTKSPLPGDARIWADWGTQRVLPTYQVGALGDPRWSVERFRSLNKLLREPPETSRGYPRPGDYVVLYSADDRTCWHCRRALDSVRPALGPFPSLGWQKVFTSSRGNLTLYRLGPAVVWPRIEPGAKYPGGDEQSTPTGDSDFAE